MAFVMAEEGAVKTLTDLKTMIADSQWHCVLFKNDVTPAYDSVLDDFEVADTIQEYANFGTQFSTPTGDGEGRAVMDISYIDFDVLEDGEVTVFGYLVFVDDVLILAERLPYPITVTDTDQQVRVRNLVFKLHS